VHDTDPVSARSLDELIDCGPLWQSVARNAMLAGRRERRVHVTKQIKKWPPGKPHSEDERIWRLPYSHGVLARVFTVVGMPPW
jgi:hypothetical protein